MSDTGPVGDPPHGPAAEDLRRTRGPARALPDATRESAVVVIGAHRGTSRPGPQVGPVGHTLLRRSHGPVVLLPLTG
ncbi:hypothetical protein [Streptomyces sp. bgisy027]|uniref:hypothetical protein n=1 Tax=unclassified Streptomyces TaxID=2593676 RepID=UPI003D73F056